MNIFTLFFGLLWFGMIAVFFVSIPILGIIGFIRKSWKFFGISTGISLLAFCVGSGALWALVACLYQPYDPGSPEELIRAFHTDFGEAPPKGVTVLKARQYAVADSGVQWLLLKVDSESVEKMLSYGFTSSGPSSDFSGDAGAHAPDWWDPPAENMEYFENRNWPHGNSWYGNWAHMGLDRKRDQVWVVVNRVD